MKDKCEMSFYDVLIQLSQMHLKFKQGGYSDGLNFDLRQRRIYKGNIILMDKGKVIPQTLKFKGGYEIELTEDMKVFDSVDNPYEELEKRYENFKYSVPNKYSEYTKDNFIALNVNDIPDEYFYKQYPRQLARVELEAFVMFQEFPWENEKYHYWQSTQDKSLIIYKEWRNGYAD